MKEVVLLVIVLFPLSILSSSAQAKQINGFSVDLIHRDSPLSPFYNSSMTQTEVLRNAALRSISRINSFHFHLDGNKAETVMIPGEGDYLMKIFVGTPPVESLALADTGSNLIWIQCLPCVWCYRQDAPIFDPKKSSTYEVISCHSESCTLLFTHACGDSTQCRYYYGYGDRSITDGELATETIGIGSNASQSVAFPRTIFGCGHHNTGLFTSTSTGIVGLASGPLSLVSQLGDEIGHKFSYCLLPFSSNSTSKLKFGSESTISGEGLVSTPFVTKPSSNIYYLTLEGVSVEGTMVKTDQTVGNIIIDSGTTLTTLERGVYKRVLDRVIDEIGDVIPIADPPEPYKLCYWDGSVVDFPEIFFHFSGAHSQSGLQLTRSNTFTTMDNILCFAMIPAKEETSLFGNIAQVNFKVEYDLQGKTVSFVPADCTKE